MPLWELCHTITEDGLPLDSAYASADSLNQELPISAVLLIHGTGSQFYAAGVLEKFAEQALAAGLNVLRINTRGHDLVNRLSAANGPVWAGATYEVISECRYDIAAWVNWLETRGHSRIGLVGHSMGAVKAIYSQACEHYAAVNCVVGISPPRFCHQQLMTHPLAEAFREDYQRASDLVAAGQGGQMVFVRQPLPLLLTAEGFLAKYGPHDDYDFFRYLPNLNCPGLVLIGSESVQTSPAFADVPQKIAKLLAEHPQQSLAFELIEGANTGYTNYLTEPFKRTAGWWSQWTR